MFPLYHTDYMFFQSSNLLVVKETEMSTPVLWQFGTTLEDVRPCFSIL